MGSLAVAEWFNAELEELDDLNFILDCPLSTMLGDIAAEEIIVSGHGEELQHSFSSENQRSTSSAPTNNEISNIPISLVATDSLHGDLKGLDRSAKEVKANGSHTNWNSRLTHRVSLPNKSQFLLSFENPNSSIIGSANTNRFHDCVGNGNGAVKPKQSRPTQFSSPSPNDFSEAEHSGSKPNKAGIKRSHSSTRLPSQTRDHIMAERLRREKLAQLFIALSALVPGLKKVDKASVLEDTIKYVKRLQERENQLEEQTKKVTVESVVLVMKHNPSVLGGDNDDTSSSDETSQTQSHARFTDDSLPEVEARISDKQLLVRVHCQRQVGVMSKILNALESFRLSILSSSVLPFGDLTLNITIIAKVESECSIAVKDLVKSLKLAL